MSQAHRYLFIGGLHRSGTSLVARLAASLPEVGAIEDAPVPENEGVYLQGGIPHDATMGAPMSFATDPAQHLTESHALNRLETRLRIEADWAPWFPPDRKWRVEKSPVNLTRMRLLQQLFPLSQFVVVTRHPETVAAATVKWTDLPPDRMHAHWAEAHDLVRGDLPHLHAVLILRYEDVVRDPGAARARLAAFLSLDTKLPPLGETVRDGNRDYPDAIPVASDLAPRIAPWGYAPGGEVRDRVHGAVRHPLRAVRDSVEAIGFGKGQGRGSR